jgi:hypothetical protein
MKVEPKPPIKAPRCPSWLALFAASSRAILDG